MAQQGRSTALLCGKYDLSAYFHSVTPSAMRDTHDTTTFGKNARTCLPGLLNSTWAAEGYFDSTAGVGGQNGGIDEALSAFLGSAVQKELTVAHQGLAVGNRAELALADESNYAISSPVDGVVQTSCGFQSSSGIDYGLILHSGNVSANGNSTSVDNGVATTNGGVAHLHYTASLAAGVTLTVKVQHSTNNSTWVDLLTFTNVTSGNLSAERLVVAAGTTVNRYLRALWSVDVGGGTFTITVPFARR